MRLRELGSVRRVICGARDLAGWVLVWRGVVGWGVVTAGSGEGEHEGKRGILRCCEGSEECLRGQRSYRDGVS